MWSFWPARGGALSWVRDRGIGLHRCRRGRTPGRATRHGLAEGRAPAQPAGSRLRVWRYDPDGGGAVRVEVETLLVGLGIARNLWVSCGHLSVADCPRPRSRQDERDLDSGTLLSMCDCLVYCERPPDNRGARQRGTGSQFIQIRTRFISWYEIDKISPSRSGLVFTLKHGGKLTAWAATPQSALHSAMSRPCRADVADKVAELLRRRAAHHQGSAVESLRPSDRERRARVAAARGSLVLAALLLVGFALTHRW